MPVEIRGIAGPKESIGTAAGALAAAEQLRNEGALRGLGSVNVLPTDARRFLLQHGSSVALARMEHLVSSLDVIEAEAGGLVTSARALEERLRHLRVSAVHQHEIDRENKRNHLNGHSPQLLISNETEDAQRRLGQLNARMIALNARARPLRIRKDACLKFVYQAVAVAGREDKRLIWLAEPPPFHDMTLQKARARLIDLKEDLEQTKKLPLSSTYAAGKIARMLDDRSGSFKGLLRGIICTCEGEAEPMLGFRRQAAWKPSRASSM